MSTGIEDLDVILTTLSPKKKNILLGQACKDILSGRARAKTVLARLKELNPELADTFRLKDDAVRDFPFKLLCAPTAVQHVRTYIIISYCWRHSSWQPIMEETSPPWQLCRPMVEEILKIRNGDDEGVWIDVPCIDQDNESEKELAIGSMDVVYRAARRLIIVLEDIKLEEAEHAVATKYNGIFQELAVPGRGEQIFEQFELRFNPSEDERAATKSFLAKVLSARWFSRAWCNHEMKVRLRQRIDGPLILMFGATDRQVLSLEHRFIFILAYFLAFVDDRRREIYPEMTRPMPLHSIDDKDMSLQFLINRCIHLVGGKLTPSSALNTFLETIGSGCKEPKDRVSIVLNLSQTSLFFHGKADTTDHSCWVLTALTLAAGDLSPLRLQGRRLWLNGTHGFARSWAQEPRMEQVELYTADASHISAVTPDFIELDLLLLRSTPQLPSADLVKAARVIIDRSGLEVLARDTDAPTHVQDLRSIYFGTKGPSKLFGTVWLSHFLASALQCGLKWIRAFAGVLQQEILVEEWYYGEFPGAEARFESAALDILAHFNVSRDESPDFARLYLEPVTQFVTCMIDPRFKTLLSTPRFIRTSVKGQLPYALTDCAWASLYFAVPVALANTAFHSERVWLVEPYHPDQYPGTTAGPGSGEQDVIDIVDTDPRKLELGRLEPVDPNGFLGFNPDRGESPAAVVLQRLGVNYDEAGVDLRASRNKEGSWRLVTKSKLVGCPTLIPDGDVMELLERQKVYG